MPRLTPYELQRARKARAFREREREREREGDREREVGEREAATAKHFQSFLESVTASSRLLGIRKCFICWLEARARPFSRLGETSAGHDRSNKEMSAGDDRYNSTSVI
jgi:hypothetical protein